MNNQSTILIVDDDPNILEMVADGLSDQGYNTVRASNSERALKLASEQNFLCLLLDYDLGQMQLNGIELGLNIQQTQPDVIIIIMTGYHNIKFAVDAMRRQAFQYLIKPFRIEQILGLIEQAQEKFALKAEIKRLEERVAELEQENERLLLSERENQNAEFQAASAASDKPGRALVNNERVMQSYERQKQPAITASKKR
jgi:DNA-binding NtrC family response regulator